MSLLCVCVVAFFFSSLFSFLFSSTRSLRLLIRRATACYNWRRQQKQHQIFAGKFGPFPCCHCCILMTMNNFMSSIIPILLKIMSPRKLMFYAVFFSPPNFSVVNSTCEEMVVTSLPPPVIIQGKSWDRVFFFFVFCSSLSTFKCHVFLFPTITITATAADAANKNNGERCDWKQLSFFFPLQPHMHTSMISTTTMKTFPTQKRKKRALEYDTNTSVIIYFLCK